MSAAKQEEASRRATAAMEAAKLAGLYVCSCVGLPLAPALALSMLSHSDLCLHASVSRSFLVFLFIFSGYQKWKLAVAHVEVD